VTPRVVLATRNPGKVVEIRRIFAEVRGLDIDLIGLDSLPDVPDVDETGSTFADNALLKARAAASATGLPAIGDDSGICVDALDGAPGVHSARWGGEPPDDARNLALLLQQVDGMPEEARGAQFVCVAAVVTPAGEERVVEGQVAGTIIEAPRGTGGFGYDPIFVPLGETRTTAEMSPTEKDAISHRGRAFRALAPVLADLLSN
jgi:XTP/dITP diphosphohydrolase